MTSRGTTIIEIVIYTGLLALIMTSAILILFQVVSGHERAMRMITIQNEADFIMEKIHTSLPHGTPVTSPLPGTHTSTLTVISPTDPQTPLSFSQSSSALIIQRGGQPALPLTSSAVSLTALDFSRTTSTDTTPALLTTTFTLDGETFTRTTVLMP